MFVDNTIPDMGQVMAIAGDEAAHAIRVKRLEPGEAVCVMDGAGVIGEGRVERAIKGGKREGPTLEVRIGARREVAWPGVTPGVEVFAATPKGGRVDEMVDGLSQVGAAVWSPLQTERGVVDPREAKLARLERIAREAAKQCGRAWVLRIGGQKSFAEAIVGDGVRVVVADATGEAWAGIKDQRPVRLLIGPEGGWTEQELAAARRAGVEVARFGVHTMRIETAAVAACAIIMSGGAAKG
jgi:16S rRNA (uracil1498-N3)-methyltransferase